MLLKSALMSVEQVDVEQLINNVPEVVPFTKLVGLKVEQEGDRVGVILPDLPELQNHVQTQHAGALFTAAETAAGLALVSIVRERFLELKPVVEKADISYLKPARGEVKCMGTIPVTTDELFATLEADGRFRCEIPVAITDGEGTLVAESAFHYYIRKP